jgi:hypothetical protein
VRHAAGQDCHEVACAAAAAQARLTKPDRRGRAIDGQLDHRALDVCRCCPSTVREQVADTIEGDLRPAGIVRGERRSQRGERPAERRRVRAISQGREEPVMRVGDEIAAP